MEYLQDRVKKVQQEKGLPVKEITLHMDVKTRWNSIITMLDSILKVPVPVIFYIYYLFQVGLETF